MILTEQPIPGGTRLLLETTNQNENTILHEFARNKEPLTATIEHDNGYTFSHLIIRKEKS